MALVLLLVVNLCPGISSAQSGPEINTGADIVSRYVWRGTDFWAAPNIQPSLSIGYAGLELGVWGAYTLANNTEETDEIDTWLSYTYNIENSVSITVLATDYYFPNTGIKWGNFNDYDNDDGPGAHTIELGAGITGPEAFPLSVFGYINVYNDEGNNAYFQADYPFQVKETELNVFIGAASGSEDNPDYYGTDDLQVINLGVRAERDIKISGDFTLPLSVSFIMNPNIEVSYLVLGFSL